MVNTVAFEFSRTTLDPDIDTSGFEKFQKDDGKWVINDLENGVPLAVEETEETLEIKVRSS